MDPVTAHVVIDRPREEVFDYLADFTHTNEWDPGTVETTRTSGDGGVGTTYANTSEFMGRRTDLVYETLVHERPGRLQFRGTNKSATVPADSFVYATAFRMSDLRAASPLTSSESESTALPNWSL